MQELLTVQVSDHPLFSDAISCGLLRFGVFEEISNGMRLTATCFFHDSAGTIGVQRGGRFGSLFLKWLEKELLLEMYTSTSRDDQVL